MKKKIAIIASADLPIPAVKGGAVETGIEQILDENEKYGAIQIDVYSYYDDKAFELSKNYNCTSFYFFKENKKDYFITLFIKAINKILYTFSIKKVYNFRKGFIKFVGIKMRYNNYDAILIKNSVNYIIPLRKYTDSPIYFQLHNDFFNDKTPNASKIAKQCTKIIANSEYIKKRILTIKEIRDEDVYVNRNCLDDRSFKIASKEEILNMCSQFNINVNANIILFSGRLVPQKGIKELLLAISLLPSTDNWQLVIVGNKWFSKNIKDKYLKELKKISIPLKNKVIFTNYIDHDKINILNSIATVVVVPSIWEEPAGRVVLEAEAVGTPVIISDAGGMKEYVNENSAIVVNRDAKFIDNLAIEIHRIINDKKLQEKMGKEGLKFSKQFNSEHYYKEIMTQLLDKNYNINIKKV